MSPNSARPDSLLLTSTFICGSPRTHRLQLDSSITPEGNQIVQSVFKKTLKAKNRNISRCLVLTFYLFISCQHANMSVLNFFYCTQPKLVPLDPLLFSLTCFSAFIMSRFLLPSLSTSKYNYCMYCSIYLYKKTSIFMRY